MLRGQGKGFLLECTIHTTKRGPAEQTPRCPPQASAAKTSAAGDGATGGLSFGASEKELELVSAPRPGWRENRQRDGGIVVVVFWRRPSSSKICPVLVQTGCQLSLASYLASKLRAGVQ